MFRINMNTFQSALLKHMDDNQTGVAELARGAGVSMDVIKKLRSRANATTSAETASKIAAYYGKSLSDFISGREVSEESEFVSLLSLLTPDERELVRRQMMGLVSGRPQSK